MKCIALLPLALVLMGCGVPEQQRKAAQSRIALPNDTTLPTGISGGCECVEDNNCPILEQVAGYLEVRNTACQWTAEVNEASCRYESRFVAEYAAENQPSKLVPEDWRDGEMTARHLGENAWCRI